jgi:hypothetical protein
VTTADLGTAETLIEQVAAAVREPGGDLVAARADLAEVQRMVEPDADTLTLSALDALGQLLERSGR